MPLASDVFNSFALGVAGDMATGTSGGNSGRVICTHFHRKGMLDREDGGADMEFTATRLHQKAVRGYQYSGDPLRFA